MRPRVRVLAGLVAVSMLGLVGCGSSGRDLAPPKEGAQAPPRRTSPTPAVPLTPGPAGSGSLAAPRNAPGLNFATPAWPAGGIIPREFTCDGSDVSPPMVWAGAPADTTELAIVVDDTNADGFVHDLVVSIPPTTTEAAAGQPPAGSTPLANSFGSIGWKGPCPPSGLHQYNFKLYAFKEPPGIDTTAPPKTIADQLRTKAAARAVFIGSYSRS